MEKHIPTISNLLISIGIAIALIGATLSMAALVVKVASIFDLDWSFAFQFHSWMLWAAILVTYLVFRYVLRLDCNLSKQANA